MKLDSGPRPPSERHDAIDALRGFALLGVCMVNLVSLSLYEFLDPQQQPGHGFDALASEAMDWLVNIKFITLFSLLFGLGFALQLERASARGQDGVRRYVRRLVVLLAIGAAHAWFVWWGDILFTYAIVGLLMIPFRNASDRILLIAGLVVAMLPPLLAPAVRAALPELATQAAMYGRALEAFSSPSWSQAFAFNMEMSGWARISNWALVCFVLGRFLLGYWAGRKGLLQSPDRHLPLLRRILAGALVAWLLSSLLSLVQAPMRAVWPAIDVEPVKMAIRMLLRVGPLALGIAYAVGFVLLFRKPAWSRRLAFLAPLGRMALTNYLTQNLIGIALFYGIGLGLGPAHGMAVVLLAWALVLALQIAWSHWWLERFRYGPVEWLWRWLTYGERPRLLRGSIAEVDPVH
ncbi:DUF418 domain-containing protein [Pseudomonas aeruginosa]|uniref:DUF418 domain-containing protein n=1 Tax=Pseudomonas aeruginosa TaxID=287 RepID=UPI003EBEF699